MGQKTGNWQHGPGTHFVSSETRCRLFNRQDSLISILGVESACNCMLELGTYSLNPQN